MPEIVPTVKFESIAREWRCKWSADDDKASLTAAQKALDNVLADASAVEGCISVQRIVCGGCLDFKVVTKLPAAAFSDWEKASFAPEAEFLTALKGIKGITNVETQTYTLEEVKMNKKAIQKAQEKKAEEKAKEPEPVKPPEDPAKKLKKVIKEGGKRGVEIEGAADMGGLQFFCTSVDEPEGDVELIEKSMGAMNAESDPTEEERKGGSGHIGKMVFSAGTEKLAICAYVPEDKQEQLSCEEWLNKLLSLWNGKMEKTGKTICLGYIPASSDKNIVEGLTSEAANFLRAKNLLRPVVKPAVL